MWIWTVLIVALGAATLAVIVFPFLSKAYSNRELARRRVGALQKRRERIYAELTERRDDLSAARVEELTLEAARLLQEEERLRKALKAAGATDGRDAA